jgi:hypothetical protein
MTFLSLHCRTLTPQPEENDHNEEKVSEEGEKGKGETFIHRPSHDQKKS